MFTLLVYHPKPGTPIASLIGKGDMTQPLNFPDTPLVMALLSKTLGPDLTSEWFPVLPPNQQSPYDPGPYQPRSAPAPVQTMRAVNAAEASAIADLYGRLGALPAGLIATGGASHNRAGAGSRRSE